MATSKKSTGKKSKDPTSSQAATPANRFRKQANAKARKTQDTCGHGYEKPLANYDPTTQSWKMCQDISLWEEPRSLERLPKSGMTRNGVLYQRLELAHHTYASDSSLWPTPTSHRENTATRNEAHVRRLAQGIKYSTRLSQAIALAEPQSIGYMNPTWVEWLMGFPNGWTDLQD